MLKYHEPVSAFAMYAMKRKNTESSSNSKKLKRKHSSLQDKKVVSISDTKFKIQEKTKQISIHKNVQGTNKVSINKIPNINKKKNLISKKTNSSIISKKNKLIKKPIHKRQNKNIILISGSKKVEPKKKLKNSVLMMNRALAKMKQIKQKQIKKTRVIKRTIQETTYSNSETVEENHENPVKTSRSMFEWLIYPMKIEEFFE